MEGDLQGALCLERLRQGDPIASNAIDIIDNRGFLAKSVNAGLWVAKKSFGVNASAAEIQQKIAAAHVSATAAANDVRGHLSAADVAGYHHAVFAVYGLPPQTFGGTPLTGTSAEANWWDGKLTWCGKCRAPEAVP